MFWQVSNCLSRKIVWDLTKQLCLGKNTESQKSCRNGRILANIPRFPTYMCDFEIFWFLSFFENYSGLSMFWQVSECSLNQTNINKFGLKCVILGFWEFRKSWHFCRAKNVFTNLSLFVEKIFPRSHKTPPACVQITNVEITLNLYILSIYWPFPASNVWFSKFKRFSNLWEVIQDMNVLTSLGLFVEKIFPRSHKTPPACVKITQVRITRNYVYFRYILTNFRLKCLIFEV